MEEVGDKGRRCIFVGHSKESKSYKLMTGKRIISEIVVSDEKGASKWTSMQSSLAINMLVIEVRYSEE